MSSAIFKKVEYPLIQLIHEIEQGEIGLPDIQRPFVWKFSKVRDLFDSMYRGFPIGYLLFWSNDSSAKTRHIGTAYKQTKIPRLLIIDGQQRLTSLFAVLRGHAVMTSDYREMHIRIAFRPSDSRFEVTDAAIERDPEFISDISQIWASDTNLNRFCKDFLKRLQAVRTVGDDEEDELLEKIGLLHALQNYSFTAMEISSNVAEEQVSEIFVRINSAGVSLNQADFILTLLSVFWDEGRYQLEKFCQDSRKLPSSEASPFNYFIKPDPDQILRVCVGFGFKRARLQHVYSILRGKDLESGEFSEERRIAQFEILKKAQSQVLNLTNWHEFLKVLIRAGFRSSDMITSEIGLLYSYIMFLIGKQEFEVEPYQLRNIIARWFFMSAITGRYSNSPESAMESDLARLRTVANAAEFIETLDNIIKSTLTEDYWNIRLVDDLESSSARTPVLFAHYAALNLLGANVLFSRMKVYELLDPAIKSKKSATERHHLFPKDYLKKLGITEVRDTNQIANFALVEWGDNIDISNKAPFEYFPHYANRFSSEELTQMLKLHALPENWGNLPYKDFLIERRKLMAQIIRQGFEVLLDK